MNTNLSRFVIASQNCQTLWRLHSCAWVDAVPASVQEQSSKQKLWNFNYWPNGNTTFKYYFCTYISRSSNQNTVLLDTVFWLAVWIQILISQCRKAKSIHDIIKQNQHSQRSTGTDKICSKRITVACSCMHDARSELKRFAI